LGSASSSSIAPGIAVGYTYYDKQSNGTVGRMVDWGGHAWPGYDGLTVHFLWTWLPSQVQENRGYGYNFYNSSVDDVSTPEKVQPDGEYAGYVAIDARDNNEPVLGGHNNQGAGYQPHLYWHRIGGFPTWFGSRIPDSVIAAGTGQNWQADSLRSAIWPKLRYQEAPGHDPVTHLFTQVSEPGAGDPQAIIYFRKVGIEQTGVWDYPPYVVDTVFDIAQDVACSNTDGKVGLVWFANLPDPGDCDTCSSQSGWPFVQWDNDVYYQVSYDYGSTWQPRVNLTKNVDGEEGHRPYTDASALIDSDDNLHIAWSARVWPADANTGGPVGLLRGRIFHWSENLGTGGFDVYGDALIRTAGNLEWDQTTCNGGAWNLNGCKLSVSECNGKLYCLWTQFNDIPAGIEDDCHNRAIQGTDVVGAANGELYVAVSDDGGMNWDSPRDLTNTHTPGCDSANGAGGRCQSEVWPSMARFGTNETVGSNVVVVDPSGNYNGDYFLDVQYVDDADPGSIISDEGTWQNNPIRWFRLACVEPVEVRTFEPSWWEIDWPAWTEHGIPLDTPLVITNSGNVNADFTITVEEDPGPYSGWLTLSSELQGAVTVEAGFNNTVSGAVTFNAGGLVDVPGTVVHLGGRLIVIGNQITSPDTLPVDVWVVDSLLVPTWDTLSTGCLALTISNHGNFGHQAIGRVNMDFFDYGDCDDLEGNEDTIPGNSTVYLNDGSPVVCWPDGDSVICNWSIFGDGFPTENGFIPTAALSTIDSGAYVIHQSEFITSDSTLLVRKAWIVPQPESDSCTFFIQRLEISSADGATHAGLDIGEAVDWDIPSDSGLRNLSGFVMSRRLIYQQGSEYNQDDDIECQQNSDRFGGLSLLQILEVVGADTTSTTDFWGAYTEDNASWVYPNEGFVPRELDSMMVVNEGYNIESDSLNADIHSVMTYRHSYTATSDNKLIVYSCLASDRQGHASFMSTVDRCHQWFKDHLKWIPPTCCMGEIRGNVNYDPEDQITIDDLVCFVDYMFFQTCTQQCYAESNVDGIGPDDASGIDISDLVHLVDYMFTDGPPPAPCPGQE